MNVTRKLRMQAATSEKKQKPPYLLGLLCLLPLMGAFVGLGLLLYGLIKYKDKWLSIIGALGILWTIVIYSLLFYVLKHPSLFKESATEITQIQLKSLVKDIEFYKLQHGQYPDSLKELLVDDKFAPITDDIQLSHERKNDKFNYRKVLEKYMLFSSGEDGIPNTKDDLFPHIAIADSSKIQLIKKAN